MFIIEKSKRPDVLLITPLAKGDTISDKTTESIKNNNTKIDWICLSDNQNPYKNFDTALKIYEKRYNLPDYIIKIDNDIEAEKNMLPSMIGTLKKSSNNISYTYCSFCFTGHVNLKINAIPFDSEKLIINNYISSMSMMKTSHLKEIGGVVKDDKYFRLLDWALWLKFLNFGYFGEPTYNTSFKAYASENSVSNRGFKDYQIKAQRVIEDFVAPYRLKTL